ncbi:hypothetical protein FD754_013181 [Muntiacus muntjak]|uniref:Uncharacterized protein n=1 Tax=Muntiacus muntjak TaxID=9888 RepID=A0A5N3VGV0_MUNMU|nr:hypothetical protein FD754_013181 [Muntiacus muntjak]
MKQLLTDSYQSPISEWQVTNCIWRMCMRICYVHFCCQPTPQLQNYSSL